MFAVLAAPERMTAVYQKTSGSYGSYSNTGGPSPLDYDR
jgi:hypothetical protein